MFLLSMSHPRLSPLKKCVRACKAASIDSNPSGFEVMAFLLVSPLSLYLGSERLGFESRWVFSMLNLIPFGLGRAVTLPRFGHIPGKGERETVAKASRANGITGWMALKARLGEIYG